MTHQLNKEIIMSIVEYVVFLFLVVSCGSDSNSSSSVLFAKKTSSNPTFVNVSNTLDVQEVTYNRALNDFVSELNAKETKLDPSLCPTISDESFSKTCVWETLEAAEENCQKITDCIGFYKDTRRNILNDQNQADDAYYFIGMGSKNIQTIYYNSKATRYGLTSRVNDLQLSSTLFKNLSNDYPVLLNSCGNLETDICPKFSNVKNGTCVWNSLETAKEMCNSINNIENRCFDCIGFYKNGENYVGMADPVVLETFIRSDIEF